MDYVQTDPSRHLILDGNAAAGFLSEIFTSEVTASPTQCAYCGKEGEIGDLLAFTHGTDMVLRCPACENVVMRIVKTPGQIYLDMRGAAYVCLTSPLG